MVSLNRKLGAAVATGASLSAILYVLGELVAAVVTGMPDALPLAMAGVGLATPIATTFAEDLKETEKKQ